MELYNRRHIIQGLTVTGLTAATLSASRQSSARVPPSVRGRIIQRSLPGSDETLPILGFGTSRVFDVSRAPEKLAPVFDVVSALLTAGGTVLDTAHNYNRAESVVGHVLANIKGGEAAFLSTKVYAKGAEEGARQVAHSFNRLKRDVIDVVHVHNMIDVDTQLPMLRALKDEGRIKYIGLTHYSDAGIDELADFITHNKVDFIQFRYSLEHRYAEQRLFDLAQDKKIAVMINQPFAKGQLFKKTQDKPLPEWAKDLGCETWAQFFLKFILSHPAVNCVIPGTGKLAHAIDNIGAGIGHLPTAEDRKEMASFWATI